jgi:hypothetical protein
MQTCQTCKHWQGDRKGPPDKCEGYCEEIGNEYVIAEFSPNINKYYTLGEFGCILWQNWRSDGEERG